MTTEKSWKELIETGKELHEKTKDKRLPGEVSMSEFMEENNFTKDMARKILRHLIEGGLVTVRVDGMYKFYSPSK
jgi:hypothetical protein